MATPDWLLTGTVAAPCRCTAVSRPGRGRFIEKTIQEGVDLLRNAIFSEEVARRPGFLQRRDPRVKVVALLALLVVGASSGRFLPLVLVHALALALARASGISLGYFVKRVWLFVPLFTGVMVLPALFNVVTPGQPLLVVADWGRPLRFGPVETPPYLAVTWQGLSGAALLVLRAADCIALAVLLTLTTPWAGLLRALRSLGVPRVFVMMLAMTYRYIYVLLEASSELLVARKSRQIGPPPDSGEGRRFVANAIGILFSKSYSMSEEVHAAMVSRGFNGEVRTMDDLRMTGMDLAWAGAALLVAVSLLGVGNALGL